MRRSSHVPLGCPAEPIWAAVLLGRRAVRPPSDKRERDGAGRWRASRQAHDDAARRKVTSVRGSTFRYRAWACHAFQAQSAASYGHDLISSRIPQPIAGRRLHELRCSIRISFVAIRASSRRRPAGGRPCADAGDPSYRLIELLAAICGSGGADCSSLVEHARRERLGVASSSVQVLSSLGAARRPDGGVACMMRSIALASR